MATAEKNDRKPSNSTPPHLAAPMFALARAALDEAQRATEAGFVAVDAAAGEAAFLRCFQAWESSASEAIDAALRSPQLLDAASTMMRAQLSLARAFQGQFAAAPFAQPAQAHK